MTAATTVCSLKVTLVLASSFLLLNHVNPVQAGTGVRGRRRGIDYERELVGRGKANPAPASIALETLAVKGEKDDGDGGGNIPFTPPTMDGITLGEVFDFVANSDGTSPNAACENREYVDILIIGAGMAGVSAASTLTTLDPALTYAVLESTDRVGGRMRSATFGEAGSEVTVEDGANWVYEFDNNPIWEMAQNAGLVTPVNDFSDIAAYYESDGSRIDEEYVASEEQRFMQFWDQVGAEADNQWTKDHENYPDPGVRQLLRDAGWEIRDGRDGDLDYTMEWNLFAEYAAADTSIRYFPPYFDTPSHVNDMRGFEILPQTHYQQNANPASLKLNNRVSQVNYNENVPWQGKYYKTMVSATDEKTGACTDYYAQRTISTVSAGVLNSGDIVFEPPLAYSAEEHNPYYMTKFIKVFYQFDSNFWDQKEVIRVVRSAPNRGHCHHWSNLNYPGWYEGSFILRCELVTEEFMELIDPDTQDLKEETLDQLLDPLRNVFGADVVGTPRAVYYSNLLKERDWGYGGWANWKVGKTFTDFAQFFGGTGLVDYCQHNGCNVVGEWTLQLSGSASCYDMSEFTHGAFFAGDKAAKNAMREIGYAVPEEESRCDVDWVWLM